MKFNLNLVLVVSVVLLASLVVAAMFDVVKQAFRHTSKRANRQFRMVSALACLMAALALMISPLAQAQVPDTFYVPTAIVPTGSPNVLTAASAYVTNGPIDIAGYLGVANVDCFITTNASEVSSFQIFASPDQTNYYALSNYAYIPSPTIFKYTNTYWGSNLVYATNRFLVPGTVTTATPSSAGYAGYYLNEATVPFTNNTYQTNLQTGHFRIGLKVQDAYRYLYFVWNVGTVTSNAICGEVFNGIRGFPIAPSQ